MRILHFTPRYRDGIGYHYNEESRLRTRRPVGAEIAFFDPVGLTTPAACNKAARLALDGGCDYLWLTAHDVAWGPDALLRLLSADKDVVAGICMSQYWPHRWHAMTEYRAESWRWAQIANRQHGLMRVEGLGGGFWLIKTEALRRIRAISPFWFEFKTVDEDTTHPEDLAFCKLALDAGVELWADWDTPVAHSASGYYTFGGKLVSQGELRHQLWGTEGRGGVFELGDDREPELKAANGFHCMQCGACCRARGVQAYTEVTYRDFVRLGEHLKMPVQDIYGKYCHSLNGRWYLKDNPDDAGACIFLVLGKCAVYEARPDQCRAWPANGDPDDVKVTCPAWREMNEQAQQKARDAHERTA